MKTTPHSPINISRSRRKYGQKKYANVKAWVVKAIAEKSNNPPHQMWKGEPSAETISEEQKRRIKFLRKHGKHDPELLLIADCLEQCDSRSPCCSGACPQCSRLFQRFYVRHSKRPIRDIIAPEGRKLIALCIIPSSQLVRHGQLKHFSIANFQRRIKAALDAANIKSGIGGVDFSRAAQYGQARRGAARKLRASLSWRMAIRRQSLMRQKEFLILYRRR